MATDQATVPHRGAPGRRIRLLRVRVTEGPDVGTVADSAADRPLVIGTAPDNDLVLHDSTVSRYHLELVRRDEGVAVSDVGSLNGTYLGVNRIDRGVVPAGTHLRIGTTSLVIEEGASVVAVPEPTLFTVPGLVASSPSMQQVLRSIEQLAASSISVLVEGETGTGKERVAQAIHAHGPRHERRLVVVDCGAIPATLAASELFGHERGAFTGADRRQVGAFEQADGGTIFLDEIGELTPPVQAALLGVLERRRFRRLGGEGDIHVDVRVISATHRDLRDEVNRGTFRPDLYYRLSAARIVIPPLRERPEDLEPLLSYFVEEATGNSRIDQYFGPPSIAALRAHRWSGNVRELRNVVESALALGRVSLDGSTDQGPHDDARETPSPQGRAVRPYREARADALNTFEVDYLGHLMESCKRNASEAARRAKMDRQYLLSLLRRHGLR